MDNIVVSDLNPYLKENDYNVIVVYEIEIRYTNINYAARLFIRNEPTKYIIIAETLEKIRDKMPNNYISKKRHKKDNKSIVEIFINERLIQ